MELTYFSSLIIFLSPPLLILTLITAKDLGRRRTNSSIEFSWSPYVILSLHIIMAVIYTTPWDNYLVATGVWWYDKGLVSGITFGYVPLEEYIFFILQTLLTGLAVITIWYRFETDIHSYVNIKLTRNIAVLIILITWAVSTYLLLYGEAYLNYLTLILSWALIPIIIQVAFGGDILWVHRKPLIFVISATTVYLWIMDAISINSGIWTIDPAQTTGFSIGSLPIEEMLFFLMTNVIISFGVTLMLSPKSKARVKSLINNLMVNVNIEFLKTKDV